MNFKYLEWNYGNREYESFATIETKSFENEDYQELKRLEDIFKSSPNILSRSIAEQGCYLRRNLLEKRTKRYGRISSIYAANELRRAISGESLTQRIYDRRVSRRVKEKEEGLVIGVLLDQSGSTSRDVGRDLNRLDVIKYAAIILGDTLNSTADNFFIYSFHTHRSSNPTIVNELKTESEVWTSKIKSRIASLRPTHDSDYPNNKDGAMIRHANGKITEMPHKRKCLFIISDGSPNCDKTYYRRKFAYEDTSMAFQEGLKQNIEYYYMRTVSDTNEFMDYVKKYTTYSKLFEDDENPVEGITLAYEHLLKSNISK